MFETSSVTSRKKFNPLTLAVSATLHVAAIATVTFMTIWDVQVPEKAPDQIVSFQVAAAPPPPLISKGSPEATRRPVIEKKAETSPAVDTAPIEIPEIVAPLDTAVGPIDGDGGSEETFGDPLGVDGGDPDGDVVGEEGGTGTTAQSDTTYSVGHGVRAPVIVRRVEPLYPSLLQRLGKPGVVQLECIISKSGTLTDIRVIHASHPLFAESAITAVRQWTFLPGTLNGKAVSTRFDFTVTFNIKR